MSKKWERENIIRKSFNQEKVILKWERIDDERWIKSVRENICLGIDTLIVRDDWGRKRERENRYLGRKY